MLRMSVKLTRVTRVVLPNNLSTSRLISFSAWRRLATPNAESDILREKLVRLVNSDHGLFYDLNRRRALILINPDKSLIGPLETKPKEKQNNFQKMKHILKCRLQSGSHFVSQQH